MKFQKLMIVLLILGLITIAGCFNFSSSRVRDPVFNYPSGTYDDEVTVTITTATSGATIHYTTDGSTPDESSQVYSGALTFYVDTTLRAMAAKSGALPSNVVTGEYLVESSSGSITSGVARTLSASTVSPSGQITVTLTKTVPAGTQALLIEETSQGTLANPTCGGVSSNILRVAEIEGLTGTPSSGTCMYTLTAPGTPGTYTISGQYSFDGVAETITGPASFTVQ